MNRGALEQYLISRQLPTSGTIQQLRERALTRLEEGTPEQLPKQSTTIQIGKEMVDYQVRKLPIHILR